MHSLHSSIFSSNIAKMHYNHTDQSSPISISQTFVVVLFVMCKFNITHSYYRLRACIYCLQFQIPSFRNIYSGPEFVFDAKDLISYFRFVFFFFFGGGGSPIYLLRTLTMTARKKQSKPQLLKHSNKRLVVHITHCFVVCY